MTRPPGLRAGFHAEPDPTQATGLIHAGEQWAPDTFAIGRHAHAGWELYLQAHGTTRWRVAGAIEQLAPGDVLVVAPTVEHALAGRPSANHHFYYAAFERDAIQPTLRDAWSSQRGFRHVAGGERLAPPFQALVRELAHRLPFAREGLVAALDALVVEASRLLAAPKGAPILPVHPAVVATRDLLDAHHDRRWTLAELAARVGLSPKHLHELFSRELGITPHRYQLERRMRRARELLATTDLPVTTIAFELGFGSGQQFSRTFRQQVGCPPRAHRARARAPRPVVTHGRV